MAHTLTAYAQIDFNFEKRDWMTVGLKELPEGSNLVSNRRLLGDVSFYLFDT